MADFIELKKDAYLFKQGDPADCMYIVKSGKLSITISDGVTEKEVDSASPGQLIGEMSLFDRKNRSASARALFDSSLVRLPYDKLEMELKKMPEWVQVVLSKLSEKIRETNDKILKSKG